jgi:hypothetical protein
MIAHSDQTTGVNHKNWWQLDSAVLMRQVSNINKVEHIHWKIAKTKLKLSVFKIIQGFQFAKRAIYVQH